MSSRPSTLLKLAATAALAGALAACAHKPPPPPEPPPPPPPEAPLAPPPAPPPGETGVSSAPIPGSVRDFVISAGDRVYFEFNADTLSAEGQGVLNNQAQWLQRYPAVTVRIEGNCDPRGTEEYNLALGARRAAYVKNYLVSRGISPARITTISFGKERPIDPGTGDEAWAHDRNAHTAITSGAVGGGTDSDYNGPDGAPPPQ